MTPRDLEELATRTAESLWREIARAFALVRGGIIGAALERYILERKIEQAVASIGLEELTNALAKVQVELGPIRDAGYQLGLVDFPKSIQSLPILKETLGATAIRQPDMLNAIRAQDLSRIQGITTETQEAIRDILANGIEQGIHPTTLARELRSQIGLTRQGVKSVAKYRSALEQANRKPADIERLVAKRVQVLTNRRARTIARTEVARAQTEGTRAQWDRMVRAGIIKAEDWEREWRTSHLENVCPICVPFDGQRADLGGFYISKTGRVSQGPIEHVNCVCAEILVPRGFRAGQPVSPARDRILARNRGAA